MDEYLMKYGFSPLSSGVDRYFKSVEHPEGENNSDEAMQQHKHHHDEMPGEHNYSELKFSSTELKNLPLAMAYVPMQKYRDSYTYEEALKAGTLFPELDKPFLGRKGMI